MHLYFNLDGRIVRSISMQHQSCHTMKWFLTHSAVPYLYCDDHQFHVLYINLLHVALNPIFISTIAENNLFRYLFSIIFQAEFNFLFHVFIRSNFH